MNPQIDLHHCWTSLSRKIWYSPSNHRLFLSGARYRHGRLSPNFVCDLPIRFYGSFDAFDTSTHAGAIRLTCLHLWCTARHCMATIFIYRLGFRFVLFRTFHAFPGLASPHHFFLFVRPGILLHQPSSCIAALSVIGKDFLLLLVADGNIGILIMAVIYKTSRCPRSNRIKRGLYYSVWPLIPVWCLESINCMNRKSR